MLWGRKFGGFLSRVRWPLAAMGLVALFFLATRLRESDFSSEFIVFSYLQIVGSLLCLTCAANALVRYRSTHERLTLILALSFILAGLLEAISLFAFYLPFAIDLQSPRAPLPWIVGRTLLAVLLLAAVLVERRLPQSRERGRDVAVAFFVVGAVVYVTAAVFLSAPAEPAIYPFARIARPWELVPAAIFAWAAIGLGQRGRAASSVFSRALCVALWMNVACHVVMAESARVFDAPFTLAQAFKVASYAVIMGGALLDNAQLFDQVQRMAVSDSLTGLGNYRTLVNALETEIQRSQRTGRSFALVLMDLDGLKQVNDRYGHLVGSQALRRLGNVLRTNCRTMDTAARYGGDEFALILPEASAAAAECVGRRIRDRLANDGEEPCLSVSVGVSAFPRDGRTIDELVSAADSELYGMKRHGGLRALAQIAACL